MYLVKRDRDLKKAKFLFNDIRFYMGNSVLEGCMGECFVDNISSPKFAFLLVRNYCFISGEIEEKELKDVIRSFNLKDKTIIASDKIKAQIKNLFPDYKIITRYSIKKNPKFDESKLNDFINSLHKKYKIRPTDDDLAKRIKTEKFINITDDYENKGIGFCCFYKNEIVGVASSNIIYKHGIEVNVKTSAEHRQQGIALALASCLILECIKRNMFVSWDAAHLGSVILAEKLGFAYHSEYECLVFNYNQLVEDKKIADILSINKVKGASVAIINNYQIDYFKVIGSCDSVKNQKLLDKTLFQVASISKPVFAAAVLKMYENGLVDIKKDVDCYLKDWKLERNIARKVTIEELLSHNGGINVGGFSGYKKHDRIPSIQEILNGEGNSAKIVCDYSVYKYSGGGYEILQYVVEKLMPNLSFQDIMKKHLFDLLDMGYSKYYTNVASKDSLASDNYNIYPEFAAAGLYTTALDIAKLGMGVQKSLYGFGFLKKQTVEKMLARFNGNFHGLGFRVSEDSKNFWHGGINNNFYSHCVFTKDGKGVVILTNGNSRTVFDDLEKYIKQQYQ